MYRELVPTCNSIGFHLWILATDTCDDRLTQVFQACRGENIDKGVEMKRPRGLKVQADGLHSNEDYVIPLHADMLMMWASYPGVCTTPLLHGLM